MSKKLQTWTIKKAWKIPGPLSLDLLREVKADAEFIAGLRGSCTPVSIVITELPVKGKK